MTFFAFIVGMFAGAAVGIIAAALADAGKDESSMSVDKWRWTPNCDKDYCIGDCDLCDKEDEKNDCFFDRHHHRSRGGDADCVPVGGEQSGRSNVVTAERRQKTWKR